MPPLDTARPTGRRWKRQTFPCHPDTTGRLADADDGSPAAAVSILGLSGMGVILLADHHRQRGEMVTVLLANAPRGVVYPVTCRVTDAQANAEHQWVLRAVFDRELGNRELLALI
jgi:hypothetical protein